MKLRYKTFIKYFLSYFLVFSLLFLGAFFIIRGQLSSKYFNQLCAQNQDKLLNYMEQFQDDITYLSQINESVTQNTDVLMAAYRRGGAVSQPAGRELSQFDASSRLINSIIFYSELTDIFLTTGEPVLYRDNIFRFYRDSVNYLTFDPTEYMDDTYNQLIALSDKHSDYLLYFPGTNANSAYILLYMLDQDVIEQSLENLLSDSLVSIVLLDPSNHIVAGVNEDLLIPYLNNIDIYNRLDKIDAANTICVQAAADNTFSLIALFSNDQLIQQIDTTFSETYFLLNILGVIGFFLMIFAMQITYAPLHALTRRFSSDFNSKQEYTQQLDEAFRTNQNDIQELQNKLKNYRLHMQKSLLDSAISDGMCDPLKSSFDIDSFFDSSNNNEIFVLRIKLSKYRNTQEDINTLLALLGKNGNTCILLEQKDCILTLLLNIVGDIPEKEASLCSQLNELHDRMELMCALSNSSSSPFDIPALYANALNASALWNKQSVVCHHDIPISPTRLLYPHESLAKLSKLLITNDIVQARVQISDLYEDMDYAADFSSILPDFYIRCILIDILMSIIEAINQAGIPFIEYSDLYYNTLYLCRNTPYKASRNSILENTEKLLCYYEAEAIRRVITSQQLRQYIETNYCDSNFSLTMMADAFRTSEPNMSKLVQDKLDANFSAILWDLRCEKAKILLKDPELTIDIVSVMVGYPNVKSFRRKFKQETGLTPSEYRSDQRNV